MTTPAAVLDAAAVELDPDPTGEAYCYELTADSARLLAALLRHVAEQPAPGAVLAIAHSLARAIVEDPQEAEDDRAETIADPHWSHDAR